jgi:hypothetical protein
MITSAPAIPTTRINGHDHLSVAQNCGPVRHFQRQARAGALQEIWECPRCGKVNQPFSTEQILLMREHHGVGLGPA